MSRRKTEPTAGQLMTTGIVTVKHDLNILQAAELLLEQGVSNAPVVEQDFDRRILLGFVSEKDLIACYASGAFYRQPDLRVAEIMRKHPVCVRPQTGLFTLAAIFMQSDYRHLPVAEANILQGMVSRRETLRALVAHYHDWARLDPARRKIPDVAGIFAARHLVE